MHRMFKMLSVFLLVGMILGAGAVAPASAEEISVSAEVDTHTVQAGSPVLFIVTVRGTQDVEPVELPEIKGFKARYLGPRNQISIINGKSSTTVSFVFNLYGMEIGNFQIPAIPVTIDNKVYATEPINMEVVDEAVTNSSGQEKEDSTKERVFLVLGVPTKEYYVGEKIPLVIKLYASANEQIDLASNIDLKRKGFDIDDIVDSRRYQQMLGSENFNVFEFMTFIYPQQTGELTLGPAQLLCKILVNDPARKGSVFPDTPSIFDDEIFSGFFNNEWESMAVKSADIAMKVLPLPEEGKPNQFSGVVGKFSLDVSVSPMEVSVGDPVTLRMKISGDGSLKNVSFPTLSDPQFKFYDPQIHEDEDGAKILEQVVIPKSDQIKEFPAIQFSYFDTEKRQYETIGKGPFPLKVTPAIGGSAPPVIGGKSPVSEPPSVPEPKTEKLGQDISFIKDHPGTFRPVGSHLYNSPVFVAIVIVAMILWIAGFAAFRVTHRLRTDTVFAGRFLAPRKARQELQSAKQQMAKGDQKGFYDHLFRILRDYVGHKTQTRLTALSASVLEDLLKTKRIDPAILADVKEVATECEMVRFASAEVSKGKMESSLMKVQKIIDHLERNWS